MQIILSNFDSYIYLKTHFGICCLISKGMFPFKIIALSWKQRHHNKHVFVKHSKREICMPLICLEQFISKKRCICMHKAVVPNYNLFLSIQKMQQMYSPDSWTVTQQKNNCINASNKCSSTLTQILSSVSLLLYYSI